MQIRLIIFSLALAVWLAPLPSFAGVEIKPQSPSAPSDPDDFIEGNYWALIIGINKYPAMDRDKQLEAARKDAEAVSKLLVERYGFSKERMVELYDENASRKAIIRAFSSLKRRLTDKDSLFIYYAGHGEYEGSKGKPAKERADGMGYWIPSDAELDDPSSYIFNSQVRDYMANIAARHIYLVADAPFSGSLMGRTRALSAAAIKELYQEKSRWVLASGGLYPVPDVADRSKNGHSSFAWHFMKILRQNTQPYLLPKDISEPVAIRVSNEVPGQLPRSAPVLAAGDEGGQFVFRLKKEFLQQPGETSTVVQDTSTLEKQLRESEEKLKKQQEEFAAKKQAMLDRIKKAQEEAARESAKEEGRLSAEIKAAEEKAKREAEERQARLKAESDRVRKLEEEETRLAELKRQQDEKKRRRLADLKREEDELKQFETEVGALEDQLAAKKYAMLERLRKGDASQAEQKQAPQVTYREANPQRAIASDVDQLPSPKVRRRENAYAVVIGIETYRENLQKADFGAHDARTVAEYLTKAMGFPEQNVAVLLNERAGKADLEKYIESWLPNRVTEGDEFVFVYFSGHGAPNPKTQEAYLVPWDGDPAFVNKTGYPLKSLYGELGKLPAKEVVVVLDSCFSGAGGRSVIAKGMRPLVLSVENTIVAKGKTMVLAASAGDQVSSTYSEKGHGLLTYFFLKGLQGEADRNKDGVIELAELFDYVKPQVQRLARREYNNDQTPQLVATPEMLKRGVRLVERAVK